MATLPEGVGIAVPLKKSRKAYKNVSDRLVYEADSWYG